MQVSAATADWRVPRPCVRVGNQQPSPVTRSCLHVVHAARAQQTAAGRCPLLLRSRVEQHRRTRTEPTDADAAILVLVSIGAHSGGVRSCGGWLGRISSRFWQ